MVVPQYLSLHVHLCAVSVYYCFINRTTRKGIGIEMIGIATRSHHVIEIETIVTATRSHHVIAIVARYTL